MNALTLGLCPISVPTNLDLIALISYADLNHTAVKVILHHDRKIR